MSVDKLSHKHELLDYDYPGMKDRWPCLDVEANGAACRVRYPAVLDGGIVRVVRADLSADGLFLYVVGETRHDYNDWGPIALLLMAKRGDDGAYWAGLAHEMYPLAVNNMFIAPGEDELDDEQEEDG